MFHPIKNNKIMIKVVFFDLFSKIIKAFIIICFPVCCCVYAVGQKSKGKDCLEIYRKVLDISKNYHQDKFYFHFKIQYELNGAKLPPVDYKIWSEGKKCKIVGGNLIIYQDPNTQLLLSMEQKLILIRPVVNNSNLSNDFYTINGNLADSLNKYTKELKCYKNNERSKLIIEFESSYYKKYLIKRIEIDYNETENIIYKGVYDYLNKSGKTERVIYEYIEFKNNIDKGILINDVLSILYAQGKVKEKYKNYQIKDLRKNPILNTQH